MGLLITDGHVQSGPLRDTPQKHRVRVYEIADGLTELETTRNKRTERQETQMRRP